MNRSPAQMLALAGILLAASAMVVAYVGRDDTPVEATAPGSVAPEPTGAESAGSEPTGAEAPGSDANPTPTPGTAVAFVPPDLGPVPDIVDISGWLNTDGSSFAEVRGPVTIVQFWTFGCSNCRATLPHLQELYAARHDDGLEIIGIHAHEFDRERDPNNVAEAVVDLGVTWPVALDTNKTNFVAWQGSPRFWPRTYVIDGDGRIRFDHIGEGDYDELVATVDALLAEHDAAVTGPA